MKRKTIFHNSSAVKQNTPKYDALLGFKHNKPTQDAGAVKQIRPKYDALLGFKHNKPTQNAGAEVADLIKQGLLMQYLFK